MRLIRASASGANDNKFSCFVMFFFLKDKTVTVRDVSRLYDVNKLSVAKLSCFAVYCLLWWLKGSMLAEMEKRYVV